MCAQFVMKKLFFFFKNYYLCKIKLTYMLLDYYDFQITENFSTIEFHCKDGARVPSHYIANVVYVALQLQRLRNLLGNCSILINSAYRSYSHNVKVGGAPKSNHLTAQAVDIRTQKYTSDELYKKIKEYVKQGYIPDGEIIRYSTFVHYAPRFELKYSEQTYLQPFDKPFELL